MKAHISSYCKIKNNTVWLNGNEMAINNNPADFASFLTDLYKQIGMNYPKFFKMDSLCKLGMLAAELTIRNASNFEKQEKNKVAIVLSNNAASLETDRNHQKTITDKTQYFPSPAVFVYTLPNIVIGEIAIKYKLTGENAFFISEKFDQNLMYTYTSILLQEQHTDAAICGWINVDGNEYEAFVYCLEKSNFNRNNEDFNQLYTAELIRQLYNKN
jgi:hypothetical protein